MHGHNVRVMPGKTIAKMFDRYNIWPFYYSFHGLNPSYLYLLFQRFIHNDKDKIKKNKEKTYVDG